MTYYALENVVYKANGEVVCVVAPVWALKSICCVGARLMANHLNQFEHDERDALRGSLD